MFLLVVFGLLTLERIQSNAVTSPQIRILDVATKASETRLIPHSIEYRSPLHPYVRSQNRLSQNSGGLKSYIIYDDYPLVIFKEWGGNPSTDFPPSSQNYLDLTRQQETEFQPDFYGQHTLPPPKPTLAYRSVYSNIIKVFDGSLGNLDRNRFDGDKYSQVFKGGFRKSPPPIDYELIRPQEISRPQLYQSSKLPDNFPNVFSPNSKFDFFSFDERVPQSPHYFNPREGFFNTHTVNYNKEEEVNPDEVEILPEALNPKKKPFLCGFIRVNQRQFPQNGFPCGRSEDDLPVTLPDFPDYSNLPNHKIPVEHRRQHFHMKRIKRSGRNESYGSRRKRDLGFGYGYSGWGSPFSYESGYDGYYPSREGYRSYGNSYGSNYYNNRDRNRNYRNSYYTGSRYDEYDDYSNNDDSNSRGLSGYLTNGGRRYESRRNNNNDDDDDNDDDNDNNRDNDSDEDNDRNSNRRDTNGRRNNDDSRDRRRSNNNNNNNNNNYDDDDYRDNRRNNNRNNNRRNNNNNNNNNNRRNNNDRYNNGRNRYYSNNNNNNNGYSNYGSSYGGYGSGGYGSNYRNNGGYGYGGYGSSFGSF